MKLSDLLWLLIIILLILYYIPLKPYIDRIKNTQKDLIPKERVIVLDRDSVIDSIYVDKNLKVIKYITTKKNK